MSNIVNKKGSIPEFVEESWFSNIENSTVFMRLYTTVSSPEEVVSPEKFLHAGAFEYDGIPVKILPGVIDNNFRLIYPQMFWYTNPNLSLSIEAEPKQLVPPSGRYVIFISPFNIDGKKGDASKIKQIFDQLEALFSLSLGRNLLYQCFWEGERPLSNTVKASYSTPILETPHSICGPFLEQKNYDEFKEVRNAFLKLPKMEKRSRISRAFHFFHRGRIEVSGDVKFSMYWTSIILLAGGSSPSPKNTDTIRIRKYLMSIYGRDKKYVNNKLEWRWCYETRNHLMHSGVIPKFHYGIEQYFHCLFLDLVRKDLDLSSNRHLETFIQQNPKFKD